MTFKSLANLFGSKKRKTKGAEKYQKMDGSQKTVIKALYVLAFTPEKMDQKTLMAVTHLADEMLKDKNPAFLRRMDEWMSSKARIEIANTEYIASFHAPAGMQTLMAGWLKNQYSVIFNPAVGNEFFVHGMRDPQGKENFFLFYFDVDYSEA